MSIISRCYYVLARVLKTCIVLMQFLTSISTLFVVFSLRPSSISREIKCQMAWSPRNTEDKRHIILLMLLVCVSTWVSEMELVGAFVLNVLFYLTSPSYFPLSSIRSVVLPLHLNTSPHLIRSYDFIRESSVHIIFGVNYHKLTKLHCIQILRLILII